MRADRVLRVARGTAETYLKFDGGGIGDQPLDDAYLKLWRIRGRSATSGLVVQQTRSSWTSQSVTHRHHPHVLKAQLNNRPARGAGGRWVTIRLAQAPRDLSGNAVALRLTLRRKAGVNVFARSGKRRPQLVVPPSPTEPTAPTTPTDPPPSTTPTDPPPPSGPTDPGPREDRVFAHYFPPYPVSIDNKTPASDYYTVNYLAQDGENGKHASYGGLLRDRPIGREPLGGDWRLTDLRTEVRQAKSAGIDGFTLDILTLSGRNWLASTNLMQAADLEGDFAVIPMVDASSLRDATPKDVADAMATLYAHPSADKIGSDFVLSSFCAECKSVSWWAEVINRLESDNGVPIKFIATFVGARDALLRDFAPISYGAGSWGTRNAELARLGRNWAAQAHSLGLTWMQAVAVQDARPHLAVYAEAGNTETLRMTWSKAISDGADFVQITTWNDYSESTSIAPSASHGSVFLGLTSYYAEWFRTGTAPTISLDHLFLTHRLQPWDATPSNGIKIMQPTLGGSPVAPRDTAEALVFLSAPATVTLRSGSRSTTTALPAGISAVLVPLGMGTTSGSITRGGVVVKAVTSPYTVSSTPPAQDLQYVAAGS